MACHAVAGTMDKFVKCFGTANHNHNYMGSNCCCITFLYIAPISLTTGFQAFFECTFFMVKQVKCPHRTMFQVFLESSVAKFSKLLNIL